MSQPGATLDFDELDPGTEWALLASSAIEGHAVSGIMAASAGILAALDKEGVESLFIFPDDDGGPPGMYLWTGTVEQALDGDKTVDWQLLHPMNVQHWLDHNGETP